MSNAFEHSTIAGRSVVRDVFIETGTCGGNSVLLAHAMGFNEIHSCEMSPSRMMAAISNTGHLPNVYLYHGDSLRMLPKMIDPARQTTFWLDAHWSGIAYIEREEGRPQCPLLDELKIIFSFKWRDPPYVAIDDANIFMRRGTMDETGRVGFIDSHWPRIQDIAAAVPAGYEYSIFDDQIWCFPGGAMEAAGWPPMECIRVRSTYSNHSVWLLLQSLAYDIAIRLPGCKVLEIGCNEGYSASAMLSGMGQAGGGSLVSVDIRPCVHARGSIQNLYPGADFQFIEGDSTHPETIGRVSALCHGKVGLLFIDGGHDKATVAADFANYSPMVAHGGSVIMHDAHLPEIRSVILEACRGGWCSYHLGGFASLAALQRRSERGW